VTGHVHEDGCARLRAGTGAWLDLPPSALGGELLLKGRSEPLPGQLIEGRQVSVPVSLPVFPSGTYVGSTSSSATLRLTLTPGRFQLCRD
jgi:hypothetical protein